LGVRADPREGSFQLQRHEEFLVALFGTTPDRRRTRFLGPSVLEEKQHALSL
jgi:hypothetical protein